MKKIASVLLIVAMLFCSAAFAEVAKEDMKIGLICLHDENMGYDANFIDSMKAALENLGMDESQLIIKTNIPEDQGCYDAAIDLAESGCNYIFADSFGHEEYIILAAEEYPEIQFSHATGTKSQSVGLENYHNAFASIYQGRFAAGYAAGLKLNEMIESGKITEDQAKVGYVGAFPYAEVISGLSSTFLGIRHACPSATMVVKFTNSWGDQALEQEAATALIASGCVLMSEHADTVGAPTACEDNNVPNVGYNISFNAVAPNTSLVSSRINWTPYMQMAIEATMKGESFPTDIALGMAEGAVELTELNPHVAAEGTVEQVQEVLDELASGEMQVYDTSTFTVNGGMTVEEYVQTEDYLQDTANGGFNAATHQIAAEYVKDGYFHESEFQSAPYFDLPIDGISEG